MFPAYSYPPSLICALLRDFIFFRKRSFLEDASAFTEHNSNNIEFIGLENIPADKACLFLMNHYSRPGFAVWWLVMVLSSRLPRNSHWTMAGGWTYPDKWYQSFAEGISAWAFARLAGIYGFTVMPPMPPRPADVEARARSVRKVLKYGEETDNPIIGLAPEGRDIPGGGLGWPPEGAGRFIMLVSGRGLEMIPVAGWEADGRLKVRFGLPVALSIPSHLATKEKDRLAAEQVMRAIAALMPPAFRGVFA